MHKETSARVSTIAGQYLAKLREDPDAKSFSISRDDLNALAGSALSQDQTPGQDAAPTDFLGRLKAERDDLDDRLIKLNSFIAAGSIGATPRHVPMLAEQSKLMSDLLAVLDERIADLEIEKRSAEKRSAEKLAHATGSENVDGE